MNILLTMDNELKNYQQKYKKYKAKFFALVKKQLEESEYPHQQTDFFFLTIPSGPKKGKRVPADYLLSNLILYFWNKNFVTMAWNQGYEGSEIFSVTSWNQDDPAYNSFDPAFISFELKLTNGENAALALEKLLKRKFGKNNVVIWDESKSTFKTSGQMIKYLREFNKRLHDFFKKNPQKILIKIGPDNVSLEFRIKYVGSVYGKLEVAFPKIEDRLPGALV